MVDVWHADSLEFEVSEGIPDANLQNIFWRMADGMYVDMDRGMVPWLSVSRGG